MLVRTQWFAFRIGYDIVTDLPYGVTLCLGKGDGVRTIYRWAVECHFDLPRIVWADRWWRIDEPDTLKGVPVSREQTRLMVMAGLRYWPKAMIWRRCFKVTRFD